MSMRSEIEEILKIQDPEEKTSRIYSIKEDMDDFSGGYRARETEEVGEAAAILLKFAFVEENEDVKEAMLRLLVALVSWHKIDKYIDWDMVIAQISHLPENFLLYALEMLGWSRKKEYIPFLERYLDHPSIWVQMEALNAISQIWWDVSNKNDEVKKMMKVEEIKNIWSLLANSEEKLLPDMKIQKHFLQVRKEFIENMKNWFEVNGGNPVL